MIREDQDKQEGTFFGGGAFIGEFTVYGIWKNTKLTETYMQQIHEKWEPTFRY